MSKLKIIFVLFIMLFAVSGCERIGDKVVLPPDTTDAQQLTLMTYNVYVGSSTEPLLSVESLLQVPGEVATMYANVIASDFPSRAEAIAKIIKTHQPHLIGLQEISLIRRQSPSDYLAGNKVLAEDVILDYLQLLMDALRMEGLQYQVAAKVKNLDVEMPMSTDTGLDDVRLTDYDVILARNDVDTVNATSANYTAAFSDDMLGLVVTRGYTAVDATVSGMTYRVVNTHLESFTQAVRVAQTQELIGSLSDETKPIILLGDFNTPAPNGTGYQMLLSAGYVDVWQMESEGTGNTCCQDEALLNEMSELYERIDQIFVRNLQFSASIITQTVGDKPEDRLFSGFWQSDHAGVVAQFTF